MTEQVSMTPPGDLWTFSVRLYGLPGVADACLALQDERGADVPALLFAAWAGRRACRLDADTFARIDATVAPWRTEVIRPLRQIRRRLKADPGPATSETAEPLRDRIKAAELQAERIEIGLLEREGETLARAAEGASADMLAENLAVALAHYSPTSLGEAGEAALRTITEAAASA